MTMEEICPHCKVRIGNFFCCDTRKRRSKARVLCPRCGERIICWIYPIPKSPLTPEMSKAFRDFAEYEPKLPEFGEVVSLKQLGGSK